MRSTLARRTAEVLTPQDVTVSLVGYPRGYITEPQQSSSRPSARPRICPRIYLRIHPQACSWTCPRVYPWTRCDSNRLGCGPGEVTRLNAGDSATPKATILTRTRGKSRG